MPAHLRPSIIALLSLLFLATGCATVTGTADQAIQVQTVDANDRPIAGMRCHATNASSDYYGNSPMNDLRILRSSSDLQIECRLRDLVARGTAISRGRAASLAAAVLPGGTASIVIDYMTGYSFSYPTWIRLRVGQDLVFDASDDIAGRPTPALQANRP